jgi:hypothetical protein
VAVLRKVVEPALANLGGLHRALLALTNLSIACAVTVYDGLLHAFDG